MAVLGSKCHPVGLASHVGIACVDQPGSHCSVATRCGVAAAPGEVQCADAPQLGSGVIEQATPRSFGGATHGASV